MPSIEAIRIIDQFCPRIAEVRASALESGFGKWTPNKGEVGSSVYEGMNFWGQHSLMLGSLTLALGQAVYPNNMFFRVTNTETEKAYVHSDREWGAKTCIVYLSEHDEPSGTGFFRHKKTGWVEMFPMEELKRYGVIEELKREMVDGSPDVWEQTDYVRGLFNRALIFHAPLFHSRWPKNGIGTTSADGRMVWVCHFHTANTLNLNG
jgi:hypothetical protein